MQSHCRACSILHPYVVSIFSPDLFWGGAVAVTISDASFCQEQEQIDGVTQNFKSQQACITALAPGNALNAEKMLMHPLSWSSTRRRRVCRSALMPMLLNTGCEPGLPSSTREDGSMFVNGKRRLLQQLGHVWFKDCESLFSHLISPNTKQVDSPETTHLGQP